MWRRRAAMEEQYNKGHRTPKSGKKADKKKEKRAKAHAALQGREEGAQDGKAHGKDRKEKKEKKVITDADRARNPKAYGFSSTQATQKAVRTARASNAHCSRRSGAARWL